MKHLSLAIGLLFSLCACARESKPPAPPQLPYDSWYVGLAAPQFMEVWVETVDVLDQRGLPFFRVHGGVASYTGQSQGWHTGGGGAKPVNNVDLPERLFLRWQSLVEPQAYKIRIPIPQWVREEMVKPQRVFCKWDQKVVTLYRDTITVGMAPGGIVKVWVGAGCLGYQEVGRFQAEIEPLGPYRGKSHGEYVPIEPENKAYIDKHGIPYGTW